MILENEENIQGSPATNICDRGNWGGKKTFKEDLHSQHVSGETEANFKINLLNQTTWPQRMEYTVEITLNLFIDS